MAPEIKGAFRKFFPHDKKIHDPGREKEEEHVLFSM
jgi:hypothetical protein